MSDTLLILTKVSNYICLWNTYYKLPGCKGMAIVGTFQKYFMLIFECHLVYPTPSLFLLLIQFSPFFSSPTYLIFSLFLLLLYTCFLFAMAPAIHHLSFLIPFLWPSKNHSCDFYCSCPYCNKLEYITKYSKLTPLPISIPITSWLFCSI